MNVDSDKEGGMDSLGQDIIQAHHDFTHPAVEMVFRMDNILEKICSHLGFNDLKQFRLVSRTCSNEGRWEFIKRDRHWVVVNSRNGDWQLKLGQVLTNLEKTSSEGRENSNQKLLGWIFKRLELEDWEHCFGDPSFLQQWGHYLRKIHLTAEWDEEAPIFSIYDLINMIHHLLTVSCPNLDEMVVVGVNLQRGEMSSVMMDQMDSLEFPSPLLKLKFLRIHRLWVSSVSAEECEVLQRFLTKLVTAAGMALEALEIGYGSDWVERRMLESMTLNVGVSNFQSLRKITLESAENVADLSHTVQKCFPKLAKLTIWEFYPRDIVAIRPRSFPALKSLKIFDMFYETLTNGRMRHFLQHFPNLEVLTIHSKEGVTNGLPGVPDPMAPKSKSLRYFSLSTEDYDLALLRCAVDMFPNLVALNLLKFGREGEAISEPEYSFGELIDTISPLSRLQHLYVNHALHTPPQLVDAIQLTGNLTGLQTLVLSQAAHAYNNIHRFNVSLYLTTSDPEFQYILDCEYVKRLKLVQLIGFRFGTTKEDMEEEAAAKGGHVSFGAICRCYFKPWFIENQSHPKTCHQSQYWEEPKEPLVDLTAVLYNIDNHWTRTTVH